MKKNFRRAMAAVMAAALTLSLAGTAAEADAAKKKKIKLASKSVTVNVKKTKTVKIKNVKASKVKKLTVKSASKKIATAKAKGKTAVKVTGKKAGKSTKVKITLKIKGQKKATKLTLKVKVAKAKPVPGPATNAPAPATQAPNVPSTKAPDAPAVSQPPQGGDASQAPATQKPSDKPKESKTPKPEWTPDPDKQNKVEDFTLTYGENGEGYKFEAASMVKFEDAANYAAVAPKDGIDVRYYDQVIVNYKSDEEITSGDEGWGGKATLSSTDEGLGCTAYTDGLYLRYLNDLKYAEGGYTVEYNIKKTGEHGALNDGYDFEDVGLVDCISVQLESNTHPYVDSEDGSQKGVNFRLMSIEFKAPAKAPGESAQPGASANPGASAKPGESAQPGASAKPGESAKPGASTKPGASATPTATPTAPPVSLKVVKNTLTVGGKTAVNVTSTEQGVTIGEKNLTVTNVPESDEVLAVLNDAKTELEAKKKGTVKITGTVQITYSGIPYTVPVTSEEIIIHAVDELVAEVHVETSPVELVADGTKTLTATGTATINDVAVTDATFTYTWASADTSVVEVADGVITAKGVGETTVTVTAVAHKAGKTDSDPSRAVVIPVKVYEKLAVTETGNIEYAETEVAINGTVAPKALKGTAITTNGEIEAANVTWALADTASEEFASIDAATGAVTGKKAGEVNVKATVKVTSGAGQEKTVVVTGTVTVNENLRIDLSNNTTVGVLIKNQEEWEEGTPIQNEDGSITFYTSAIQSGGGCSFYLDKAKSVFATESGSENYSKIRVVISTSSENGDICLELVDKTKKQWGAPYAIGMQNYGSYINVRKDGGKQTFEYDFSKMDIPSGDASGWEFDAVRVKHNAYQKPSASATESEQKAWRSNMTIHSIEFVK